MIFNACGINLTPAKKTMLTGRLMKRLRSLDIKGFDQYYDLVTSGEGRRHEFHHMIDVVTTNKTDFFREQSHFEALTRYCLPEWSETLRKGPGSGVLHVWSAACSSGEEPYTLAMVIEDYSRNNRGTLDYEILGTDISTRMLEKALQAVYAEERGDAIPLSMKRRYLMRGKGARKGSFRIAPELRRRVRFERVNLVSDGGFGLRTPMHIVFCRNVIIYFDRETQKKLFQRIFEQMIPGGYLFIGHSETLHGIHDGFVPLRTSVYQRPIN